MNDLKDKIISNIKYAQERGFTLISDDWGGESSKCACALGCVLIANEQMVSNDPEDNALTAAALLGTSEDWINNFLNGFDGKQIHISTRHQDAWKLGLEIRNETKPFSYSEHMINMDPMGEAE